LRGIIRCHEFDAAQLPESKKTGLLAMGVILLR
jgi:hypothetical protein